VITSRDLATVYTALLDQIVEAMLRCLVSQMI
jgi:hypothetical protein